MDLYFDEFEKCFGKKYNKNPMEFITDVSLNGHAATLISHFPEYCSSPDDNIIHLDAFADWLLIKVVEYLNEFNEVKRGIDYSIESIIHELKSFKDMEHSSPVTLEWFWNKYKAYMSVRLRNGIGGYLGSCKLYRPDDPPIYLKDVSGKEISQWRNLGRNSGREWDELIKHISDKSL